MTSIEFATPPAEFDGPRIPLHTAAFAADPHQAYRDMRARYGDLVPVELSPGVPATLVIGYRTALRILNDPDHFPADPSVWAADIPAECPVRPMMEPRPNVLRSAGDKHARYRAATSAALGGIDLYQLHDLVERVAAPLINAFAGDGHCEVIAQYALPLAFTVINELVGCSAELGQRIAAGMVAMFDGVGAAAGGAAFFAALGELVQEKRANPGADVTTRMMRHPIELTDEEMTHQLVPVYGAGIEPAQNLITNTLLLMLTDDRFAAGILGGALSTRDALDEVLFNDPPLANFCMSYPRQPVMMGRIWLPAHQPVVISLAACNRDPEIRGRTLTDNRAHLAFGAGPHACPARPTAQIIAQDAIDQLLDALPEIELAVQPAELVWRQGAFHRALSALPVRFPPSPPIPEHHHISAS